MDSRIPRAIQELGLTSIVRLKEDYATPDVYLTVLTPKVHTRRIPAACLLESDLREFKAVVSQTVRMAGGSEPPNASLPTLA